MDVDASPDNYKYSRVIVIDRKALAAIPAPTIAVTPAIARGIADSVAYLQSDAALRSIAIDPYWPKWDSPWWHMLLLYELGEARQIPERTAQAMVAALNALPLRIFPIHPGDAPPGTDSYRDFACHCALGCMAPVLAACGVEVARALPWVRSWFVRYQMADGGLSCDEQAYLRRDECPSSMVGTIAPLEAMLDLAQSAAEHAFVRRAGQFLIGRALVHGSATVHNASEREAALSWQKLCFPRFYFYDVLRGLAALVRWAEGNSEPLPHSAVAEAVTLLMARSPDGIVHIERNALAGRNTILPTADHSPSPRAPAASFALLDAVSVVGQPCAALTKEWTAARQGLLRLLDAGRLS